MAPLSQIEWKTSRLTVLICINHNGVAGIADIIPSSNSEPSTAQSDTATDREVLPLNSIRLVGEGNLRDKSSKSLIGSYVSARLKYISHRQNSTKFEDALDIFSQDPLTDMHATTHLRVPYGVACLRAYTTVENRSHAELILSQVNSLTIGGLTRGTDAWWTNYVVSSATNSWFRECQWLERTLLEVGVDRVGIYELAERHYASSASFGHSNRGSFSSGSFLPMGMVRKLDNTDTWLWQVEHSGSWRWEIGDIFNDLYLALGGPTSIDHGWQLRLLPGQKFSSVPVAVCRVSGDADAAFSVLTDYRRRIRRPHEDHERLPIIFNDYMNCLMGDPTEEKILALLDPVSRSGAEYFVIDAGWYADDDGWWDDVGLWEPSKTRFPSSFEALTNIIISNGLTPGLWIEPEVIGTRSLMAQHLPEDAFFHERGHRIIERGRFQLNYCHPDVRERMDTVIDTLVGRYQIGYFKFDYNIEVCQGTDTNPSNSSWTNPGAGHLDHQRAYLHWVSSLLDRYSHLVIENCSSGGQRLDYAMLAVHTIQSTSDQQDPVLYAAIAAAVPTAVTPEQSATWAYPQPDWSDETNALTVVNSLLGRIHLSGPLNRLNEKQFNLVCQGTAMYKQIRNDLKAATPFWPSGLPQWHDEWLSLGMRVSDYSVCVTVWRRGGSSSSQSFVLSSFRERKNVKVTMLYPTTLGGSGIWDPEESALRVELPTPVSARLFRIQRTQETS